MSFAIKTLSFIIPVVLFIVLQATGTVAVSQLSMVAGDSTDIQYTLVYNGDGSTICHVNTSMFPDGDGFDISYLSVFVLNSGTNIFTIHINTSEMLMSRNYSLNVSFDIEQAESQPEIITNTITILKTEFINRTIPVFLNETNVSIVVPSNPPYIPPPSIIIFVHEQNMSAIVILYFSLLSIIFVITLVSISCYYRKKIKTSKEEIKIQKEGKKIL